MIRHADTIARLQDMTVTSKHAKITSIDINEAPEDICELQQSLVGDVYASLEGTLSNSDVQRDESKQAAVDWLLAQMQA